MKAKVNAKWLSVQNAVSYSLSPDNQNREQLSKHINFNSTFRIYEFLIQQIKILIKNQQDEKLQYGDNCSINGGELSDKC